MKTLHRWFRSGAYSLPSHIDVAETPRGNVGVLIVPPFGWEDVCSYRPLRFLAKTLAASGIPVMRFDLPGTGDSSGSALDSGLFEAWVQSIDDAATELRATSGVEDVAVTGIRLGALLALTAAARGSNLQDLILWGATASGRAMLRELRAFGNMERLEYGNGDTAASGPLPGVEIGGFLIAPETQHSLETLVFSPLPDMPGRRVLLLSRDDLAVDARLNRALQSAGCVVEIANGSGYAAMMGLPHEAIPPFAAARTIVEFMNARNVPVAGASNSPPTMPLVAPAHKALHEDAGLGAIESIYTLDTPSGALFGVLTESTPDLPSTECCVLFLNAGAVRHTGPNRMWVEAARRWAKRGVPSLRLDLQGIGESDGDETLGTEGLYQEHMVDRLQIAIDSLRSHLGVRRFVAVGLCSGAFWAFHAAVRSPGIVGAILLNPRLFFWDPEVDRRRLLRRTVKGLSEWGDWCRLARGEVPLDSIKQVARIALDRMQTGDGSRPMQIPRERMAEAWAAIERNRNRMTFIFTEGEPLLREMEEEGQLPPETCSRVQCIRVANGGHTFRPLWAQRLAHELIDRELHAVLRENQADRSQGASETEWAASEA
jgi:alpha-beta hydrolase superfamily lysophospholipase